MLCRRHDPQDRLTCHGGNPHGYGPQVRRDVAIGGLCLDSAPSGLSGLGVGRLAA